MGAEAIQTVMGEMTMQRTYGARRGWFKPASLPACIFIESMTTAIAKSVVRASRRGRFSGVLLTYNATETRWCRTVAGGAKALCFVAGRRLVRETGQPGLFGPTYTLAGQCMGTIAWCFGDADTFRTAWTRHGGTRVPVVHEAQPCR